VVTAARAYFDGLQIPVWSGQISQRAGFQSTLAAGASAAEIGPATAAGVPVANVAGWYNTPVTVSLNATDAIEKVDGVWESLLAKALGPAT